MIYSNDTLNVYEKEFSFGKINVVGMGEEGRGRKYITLPTPNGLEKIVEGLNYGITIGISKSGKPRVNNGDEGKLYLLLSSSGGYTRRGDGYICLHNSTPDSVKVIDRGNGADGDAGRIGSWDAIVAEVVSFPTIVRVKYSGGRTKSDILLIKAPTEIIKLNGRDEVEKYYDVIDEESPMKFDEDGFIRAEWNIL